MAEDDQQSAGARWKPRFTRTAWLAAGGGLVVAVALGVALGDWNDEDGHASPAALNRIADKNEDAAIEAAARFKAESQATVRAADARLNASSANQAEPDSGKEGNGSQPQP